MAASDNLGPQFHGTRAVLDPGDEIDPAKSRTGGFVFSTPMQHVARKYVEHSDYYGHDEPHADVYLHPHGFVYEVEHTGPAEHDPMFKDAPDGAVAYRTRSPMRVKRTVSVLTGDGEWRQR